MSEIVVGVGHWSEPNRSGVPTTASVYAGYGDVHLVAVASGERGLRGGRGAAQAAVAAVASTFRAPSIDGLVTDRLGAAFAAAQSAVRELDHGREASGEIAVEMAAAVIERGRVTFARVGGGRLFVIESGGALSFPVTQTVGFVGDETTQPDILTRALTLLPGDKLVLATEATARTIAADIEALAKGSSPQLIAQALVGAARRRGERGGLVAHLLEVRSEAASRPTTGALSRLSENPVGTVPVATGSLVRAGGRAELSAPGGLIWLLGGGALIATLWVILQTPPSPELETAQSTTVQEPETPEWQATVPASAAQPEETATLESDANDDDTRSSDSVASQGIDLPTGAEAREPSASPTGAAIVTGPLPEDPFIESAKSRIAPKIFAIFAWDEPRISARQLKRYLSKKTTRRERVEALTMLDLYIGTHPNAKTADVLVEFLEKKISIRDRRWAKAKLKAIYRLQP